jgi:5'-deoxynucleotidase YfbR-like HD superfamily hydrolase
MEEKKLIDKLITIYSGYTQTYRSSIQPKKLELANTNNLTINFEDTIIRESLLEHVGHLPITAVTVYPYINDSSVDLGEALIMLSIHDIAELQTGDIAIFNKTQSDRDIDRDEALRILDEDYQKYFLDMSELRTNTGRFAESIDKMVADILDLLVPKELNIERYLAMGVSQSDIVAKKRERKMKYMTWNPFLNGFYEVLLQQLDDYFK